MKNTYKQKYLKYLSKSKFEQSGGGMCIVCMEKMANVVFTPCKHNIICSVCLEGTNNMKKEIINKKTASNEKITDDDKNLCPQRCGSYNYYLINDEAAINNIDKDFVDDNYIINKISITTLETFILYILSSDKIVFDINNDSKQEIAEKIISYMETKADEWNNINIKLQTVGGIDKLKHFIILLIEREKERINYSSTRNQQNKNQIEKLNKELNNINNFEKSLNYDFEKFMEQQTINPKIQNLKDEIDALNLNIDDTIQALQRYDRSNILRIFENKPESRFLTTETELLQAKNDIESISRIIHNYYWMYYQNEYYRLNGTRFPRLQFEELLDIYMTTKFFFDKYINNKINTTRDPRIKTQLSEILENFSMIIIANEEFLYDAGGIYELMQQIYEFIIQTINIR